MNHSTPGLPVHYQLPEFIQTHVHRVGDAIQPSHPLPSPSPPGPNPSQHQGLFQWVNQLFAWGGQSTGVSASASVLPVNTQDWSLLGWTGRWFQKIQTHSQDACCHEMSNRSHTNNNAGLPVCRQYLKHFTHSCFTSSDPLPRHVSYGYPSFSKLPGVSLWGFHILHSSDTG